jgi:DedD protein
MASNASPEASEIRRRGRRRLIGAITLVMLLVVFVPMVLDPEPKEPRTEPSLAIPSRDNAPPLPAPPPAVASKSARGPADKPAAPAPDKGTRGQAPAGAQPDAPTAAIVTPVPAVAAPDKGTRGQADMPVAPAQAGAQPSAATESPPAPKASADAAKLQGFAVQVGAFRDEARLAQSREKLAAAGVVHYTERLESKAGALTRLRAGPFATREQAEAALARLKRSTIEGKVVPLP